MRNAVHAKRLFDRLQESYEKLRELEGLRDNLTNMIAHDMRSPLTAISGYLELLKMKAKGQLDEKKMKYIDQARTASVSLVEMVSALVDVSRLEADQMPLDITRCDLRAVAQKAIDATPAAASRVRVVLEADEEHLQVPCDQELIRRVLVNLVSNAIKFTSKNGEVRVKLESGNEETKVIVSDAGPGIPQEFHEKIFEKFGQVEIREQRRMYSTGLGLTFCKLAVEAHAGRIGVDSEIGRGSDFWFVLPHDSA